MSARRRTNPRGRCRCERCKAPTIGVRAALARDTRGPYDWSDCDACKGTRMCSVCYDSDDDEDDCRDFDSRSVPALRRMPLTVPLAAFARAA